MKVKFYVDWDNQEILSETEYAARVKEAAKDIEEEEDAFADYLDDHYAPVEIFDLNEEEKTKVRKEFGEWCEGRAEADLSYRIDEIEKEI